MVPPEWCSHGVAHERRTVGRREHRLRPADLDRAGGVAGVLGEPGRGRRDQRSHQPPFEADAHPVDVGPRRLEQPKRLVVAAKLDADLLEDRLGVGLDADQPLLAEDLVVRDRPGDERRPLSLDLAPPQPAPFPPATLPARRLVHRAPPVGTSIAPYPMDQDPSVRPPDPEALSKNAERGRRSRCSHRFVTEA